MGSGVGGSWLIMLWKLEVGNFRDKWYRKDRHFPLNKSSVASLTSAFSGARTELRSAAPAGQISLGPVPRPAESLRVLAYQWP